MPAAVTPVAPPGLYYIGAALLTAQGWGSTVDTSQGLPKAGVDIGGGVHVPPAQSVTVHYGPTYQHPTLQEWAYWSDAVSSAALSGTVGLPVPVALDATWAGAAPVIGVQV